MAEQHLKTTAARAANDSVAEIADRIELSSAALDALHGHLIHVAELACPPGYRDGDEDMAQTCWTIANLVEAIKGKIDAALSDLHRIGNREMLS